MNIKLQLDVLISCENVLKYVYLISDEFRSVKQYSREISRQEIAVSCGAT